MTHDELLDYLQTEHGLSLRHWTHAGTRFVTGTKDGRGGITGSGETYEDAARELLRLCEKVWARVEEEAV